MIYSLPTVYLSQLCSLNSFYKALDNHLHAIRHLLYQLCILNILFIVPANHLQSIGCLFQSVLYSWHPLKSAGKSLTVYSVPISVSSIFWISFAKAPTNHLHAIHHLLYQYCILNIFSKVPVKHLHTIYNLS